MGMAASQARYLALVARKSNCEFEGQQINQARLVLSNQSANLFNQMLGLNVPVPPSTQDFTKTQYSYSDGRNNSTIDSWKQLSYTDPDYNYTVKSHYYTDIYTGSMKKMSDPQVQISGTGKLSPISEIQQKLKVLNDKKVKLEAAEVRRNKALAEIEKIKTAAQKYLAETSNDVTTAVSSTTTADHTDYIFNDAGGAFYQVTSFSDESDPYAASVDFFGQIKNLVKLGIMDLDLINARTGLSLTSDNYESLLDSDAATRNTICNYYVLGGDTHTGYANYDYYIMATSPSEISSMYSDLSSGTIGSARLTGLMYETDDGSGTKIEASTYAADIDKIMRSSDITGYEKAYNEWEAAKADYEALNRPTYIGNCEVTLLTDLTNDQLVELQQVVKDMRAQGIDTDIVNCFDSDLSYLGGVYTFQLNGNTYYTTYQNLADAYASNTSSNNYIDAQYKMPYYNASYISTRIDQEGKALLETDEQGRFKSIRFENDSATYALSVETITDEDAYQDAMNQYYYENAQYDKAVQDINAKTSLIQREDQQLELRLKQLDTEQNALKTEMEAVQKIVKDNVSDTFKTFNS